MEESYIKINQIRDVSVENFVFSQIRSSVDRKGVKLQYNDKQTEKTLDFYTQLPRVESPFGVKFFKDQPDKVYLDISIQSEEVIKKIMEIDEYIKHTALINSKLWFGHENKESIQYSHSIYQNTKGSEVVYPPTFRLKFVKHNGKFVTTAFESGDKGFEPIDLDNGGFDKFGKKVNVIPIIQCIGIWILKDKKTGIDKYGLDWRLFQVMTVKPKKMNTIKRCLISSDTEESDEEESDINFV